MDFLINGVLILTVTTVIIISIQNIIPNKVK